MALQISLPPDSPVLLNAPVQRLEYYVQIAGHHHVRHNNTFVVAVRYYADAEQAQNNPDAGILLGTGLPAKLVVMRPLDVLANDSCSAYAAMYQLLTNHLYQIAGIGTVIKSV